MIERAAELKRRFLIAAGLFSLAVLGLSWMIAGYAAARAVFAGCLVGLLDNYIMFMDVEKGAGQPFAKAIATMQKNVIKRLIFNAIAVFALHKAGIALLPLFMSYIVLHFVCLGFILINAWREKR